MAALCNYYINFSNLFYCLNERGTIDIVSTIGLHNIWYVRTAYSENSNQFAHSHSFFRALVFCLKIERKSKTLIRLRGYAFIVLRMSCTFRMIGQT